MSQDISDLSSMTTIPQSVALRLFQHVPKTSARNFTKQIDSLTLILFETCNKVTIVVFDGLFGSWMHLLRLVKSLEHLTVLFWHLVRYILWMHFFRSLVMILIVVFDVSQEMRVLLYVFVFVSLFLYFYLFYISSPIYALTHTHTHIQGTAAHVSRYARSGTTTKTTLGCCSWMRSVR